MPNKSLLVLIAAAVFLAGCGDNEGESNKGSRNDYRGPFTDEQAQLDNATHAIFNPALNEFPVPNDLLFEQGEDADGTFSGDDSNPISLALDFADGASTAAPIDINFSGSLDPASLNHVSLLTVNDLPTPNPGQNVFLLELTYPSGDAVQQAEGGEVPTFALGIELTTLQAIGAQLQSLSEALQQDPGNVTLQGQVSALQTALTEQIASVNSAVVDARAEVVNLDGGDTVLRINPLSPLKPATKYLVFVTEEVRDQAGDAVSESSFFNNLAGDDPIPASTLLPVRGAIQGWLQLAEGWLDATTNRSRAGAGLASLNRDNIAIAYTFTTGGTAGVLSSVANPPGFFTSSLASRDKKAAITLLTSGALSLDATAIAELLANETLAANNRCLNVALLTAVTADPNASSYISLLDPASSDYDSTITTFADITGATNQYILQATTATIGNQLGNEEITEVGGLDCDDGTNLNHTAEASATITNLTGAGFNFPTPAARTADFYTNLPASAVSTSLTNPATLFLGKLTLPYYLPVPTESDPGNLSSTWLANQTADQAPSDKITYRFPFPAEQAMVDVPLLVQLPNTCPTGCPVVIYQHGIFGNRSHSLALGNQLAQAGLATVAIDLPLHGVAPATVTGILDPALPLSVDVDVNNNFTAPAFKQIPTFADVSERHFGWANPSGGLPERMVYATDVAGTIGASGQNFINLAVLAASRDNNRQAVVDLFNLVASLTNISQALQDDGGGALDTSKIYFVGHSLGGIVGTPFVAVNNATTTALASATELSNITAAALVTTGGNIARILENSPSIGPNILAGLGASGLTQGSSNFETYFIAAQSLLDSVDPVNFAESLADNTAVYINEIFGDGSDVSTSDQTIPIAADERFAGSFSAPLGAALPAPLTGTEPLIALINAELVTNNAALTGNDAVVRFTAGSHTTIIQPEDATAQAVFADMAANIIAFFTSEGSAVSFNNGNFVKQEAPQAD